MMFHYIDYADTAVRNEEQTERWGGRKGGGARIRGTEMERRRRTNTAGQRGQRWEPTQRTGEKDERVKNMRDGERGK